MKRPASMLLTLTALVGLTALPPSWASAEDSAEEKPAAAPSKDNVVDAGVLHNTVHGIHFPVPRGFQLGDASTGDEIVLTVKGCEQCVLRILISPGNTDSIETTVRAIKKQVASEPSAHIIDEERTKVARQQAYTLVKEETAETEPSKAGSSPSTASAERVLTRYVTFNHGEDKYYFVLRGPSGRFGADEDGFERLLAKLRFDH